MLQDNIWDHYFPPKPFDICLLFEYFILFSICYSMRLRKYTLHTGDNDLNLFKRGNKSSKRLKTEFCSREQPVFNTLKFVD